MNPRWQVSFKGNSLTVDALDELAHRGITLVSHEARSLGDDADMAASVWLRAVDEAEAISLLKNAINLYGSFSDFKVDAVNYTMELGFLESEGPALAEAARKAGEQDARISSVILSEPAKGSAELLLDISADDEDDAIAQAKAIYADLRNRAGLPLAEPLYGFLGPTGHFPSIPLPLASLRHVELAQQAHTLFDDDIYNCAVIVSQAACERLMLDGFTELLDAQGESPPADFASLWFKNNRTTSMTDDRLRELWTLLTGDKIQEQQWWPAYREHVVRRNGAAHKGTEPTKADANESLKATDAFRAHVALKVQEALQQNGTTLTAHDSTSG